jgi:DNA-binding transcriptional LysR family regulator
MDLKHLRTFVAVAELGTVSKAALRLRIAQPALSRQIIGLENELGLTLFDRVGGRLLLTGEGEQLLGSCRRLLGYAMSFTDEARELRRGDSGVLKVAALPRMIETVFPTFVHLYAKNYPNVQVRFIEGIGDRVLGMVERGEVQLAMMVDAAFPTGDDRFGSRPLPPVGFSAAHPNLLELERRRSIDIRGLAPYPLLLLDTSFVIRKRFDAACRLAGVRPNILFEGSSPHTLLSLAEAGHGMAIIPSHAYYVRLHRYTLEALRLTYEGKPLQEPLSIFWDKRRSLARYAQDFCELLAAHIRKINSIPQSSSGFRRARAKRK